MKKFILIETIERTISTPEFFNTVEEAKKELKDRANEMMESTITLEGLVAYGETENHDNWDAEIFEFDF